MNRYMKKIKGTVAMLSLVAALASCSDWTDVESVALQSPSLEDSNPELWNAYLESLRAYKASEHKIVIASTNNTSGYPDNRSEHLVDMPDSLDYICLNNVSEVNEVTVSEIDEVRKRGTKVVGLLDFDAIEAAWEASQTETPPVTEDSEDIEEGGETLPNEATRFATFCQSETERLLAACDALGLDGVEMNFTGYDLNGIVGEEAQKAETDRQNAFFAPIKAWQNASGRELIFKGMPQNVADKAILSSCSYIIVDAHSAKNLNEMSYFVLMAATDGVPSDRFILGATTPYETASGTVNGELGDGSSMISAAAQWAVSPADAYAKAGISIDAAEADYFEGAPAKPYKHIREAINLLNPTVY